MKYRKISLVIVAILGLLAYLWFSQKSTGTEVCTQTDGKKVCQQCTCPRGIALPGVSAVACPDGAQPTCSPIQ